MGLKRFFTALALVIFSGCATVATVPMSGLAALAPNTTARFLFPSAGGTAEGYLVRPRGNGTYPLMVLLHGHSLVGIGARSLLPAADAFAHDVCYASLAVSLPGYGDTDAPGARQPKSPATSCSMPLRRPDNCLGSTPSKFIFTAFPVARWWPRL